MKKYKRERIEFNLNDDYKPLYDYYNTEDMDQFMFDDLLDNDFVVYYDHYDE